MLFNARPRTYTRGDPSYGAGGHSDDIHVCPVDPSHRFAENDDPLAMEVTLLVRFKWFRTRGVGVCETKANLTLYFSV